MAIRRGTTPWITFALPPEVSPEDIVEAYITLAQVNTIVITKKMSDGEVEFIDGDKMRAHFDQCDTLSLRPDLNTAAQLRVLDSNGDAYATEIRVHTTLDVVADGRIELYENGDDYNETD